jgi:hypothetical protein
MNMCKTMCEKPTILGPQVTNSSSALVIGDTKVCTLLRMVVASASLSWGQFYRGLTIDLLGISYMNSPWYLRKR